MELPNEGSVEEEGSVREDSPTTAVFEMQHGSDLSYRRDEGWTEPNSTGDSRSQRNRRLLLGFLLATALLVIAVDYCTNRRIEQACVAFIDWVEENPVEGIFAVICVYILATILFVPGAILTVGCGFAFRSAFDSTTKGVAFASLAVFVGAFIGSLCSFLLGRYLFRDCVLRLASKYPILQAVDRGTQELL